MGATGTPTAGFLGTGVDGQGRARYTRDMTNTARPIPSLIAAALFALALFGAAHAQDEVTKDVAPYTSKWDGALPQCESWMLEGWTPADGQVCIAEDDPGWSTAPVWQIAHRGPALCTTDTDCAERFGPLPDGR